MFTYVITLKPSLYLSCEIIEANVLKAHLACKAECRDEKCARTSSITWVMPCCTSDNATSITCKLTQIKKSCVYIYLSMCLYYVANEYIYIYNENVLVRLVVDDAHSDRLRSFRTWFRKELQINMTFRYTLFKVNINSDNL